MSKAATRRTRKTRRLAKMRIRTGKRIVVHKLRSGRTGKAHFTKRKSMLDARAITQVTNSPVSGGTA